MYHSSDPRSTLTASAASPAAAYGRPELVLLHEIEPSVSTERGSHAWYVRTSHLLVGYYELVAGDGLDLMRALGDRTIVVPHDGESVAFSLREGDATVDDAELLVFAGPGAVRAATDATIIEIAAYVDIAEAPAPVNEADFAHPVPGVRPNVERRVARLNKGVHRYPLGGFPTSDARFGRIFVSSNVMVNVLETEDGPRDPRRLSPHAHDDFEQCSITTRGRYVNHWRTPWTPDLASWENDWHPRYDSPSVAVIPPGVIHTANSVSAGPNQMIDAFAPLRDDFIAKGWVLNAGDADL
ncbi:hypothetical protein [Amycolatopsis pithecellobii]|uniref:Uncharacterized protein n=1 Tax=Amycolatopsis pithecellobii TaxID=664692 RepID=A0A6N7ZBE7_9PSEU|nr:hypothetical protein [Amycolatopsis pithecellobii]MTD59029.1 hypothetical protein [Amycolatopsis pithecellobii]